MMEAEACFPSAADLAELVRARIPGPSVLDASSENILSYCCGSWTLIQRDVTAVLDEKLAQSALALLGSLGVCEAFRLREELVNYKKVLLHVHQQGLSVERSLCQLASFFHEERVKCDGGFSRPSTRRGEIADAVMQCKGRCEATYDARQIGKLLCNLPRHPEKGRPRALEELPFSLRSWRIAAAALPDAPAEAQLGSQSSWHANAHAGISSLPWPPHVREFVRMVLVCRGADKALRIRDELVRVLASLERCILQADAALAHVAGLPTPEETARQLEEKHVLPGDEVSGQDPSRAAMAAAMQRQRHFNLLTGCMAPLRETLHWLKAIEEAAASDSGRLFVAGDGRGIPAVRYGARPEAPPAFCLPKGFQGGSAPEDQRLLNIIQTYTPQMHEILAMSGWPDSICHRLGNASPEAAAATPSQSACSRCDRRFSALWLNRGICCECEAAARAEGQCPFSKGCQSLWFCTHAHRCLKCDSHSCDQCRFSRGDGEHVAHLAARLRPARIVLDFDRTLATTRSGGKPVFGKDSVDQDLLSMLWDYPGSCMVVTRNSHVQDIKSFLTSHGAPDLVVHSLRRPKSKAEHILPGLQPGDRALFVDDTIAELMDPLVSQSESVHRVLFIRGLL